MNEGALAAATVVLPTRNRPVFAIAAARSVLACVPAPAELLIIDQSDRPDSELARLGNGATRVRYEHSIERGLSRAVNQGMRTASNDLVLVTHDDVVVDDAWVAAMVAASERAGPHVVLTGRIVAGPAESAGSFAPSLATGTQARRFEAPLDIDVLKPLNMAMTRELFDEVGGFDVRLGPGTRYPGAEDADFGFRVLHDARRAIEFVPDALVTHRAWRHEADFLALRWSYGYAHGAFYAIHLQRHSGAIARRVARDVARRMRRFPRRVLTDGKRSLGDPVFLVANLVGALDWTCRSAFSVVRALPPPDDPTSHRPTFARVAGGDADTETASVGADAVTWSVMVPTHNSADFLERTLGSALVALGDRRDVQIQVMDDASQDHPARVIESLGDDRISIHRHATNLGHTGNFNSCVDAARGEYVHLLHGDDVVHPGFYDAAERVFREMPEVGAAFCRHHVIDEDDAVIHLPQPVRTMAGVLDNWLDEIAVGNRLQASTMVLRRRVYEAVGGYDDRIPSYGEDWEMWVRVAAFTGVHYEPRPLAAYRVRSSSLTAQAAPDGSNIDQLKLVARLNRATLPVDRRDRLTRAADRNTALGALRRSVRLYDAGLRREGVAQFRAALRTSRAPIVVGMAWVALARVAFRVSRRAVERAWS